MASAPAPRDYLTLRKVEFQDIVRGVDWYVEQTCGGANYASMLSIDGRNWT